MLQANFEYAANFLAIPEYRASVADMGIGYAASSIPGFRLINRAVDGDDQDMVGLIVQCAHTRTEYFIPVYAYVQASRDYWEIPLDAIAEISDRPYGTRQVGEMKLAYGTNAQTKRKLFAFIAQNTKRASVRPYEGERVQPAA